MSEKEKRSFMSGEEKALLKEIVCQKSDIIESKKTDAISVSKKKKAWIEIAAEFKASSESSNRSVGQLKKCWENMKSRRRKELSKEKISRMATGGGSFKPPTEDSIDDIFDATLGIELKDPIDSDTVTVPTAEHSYFAMDENLVLLTEANDDDHETQDLTVEPVPGPSHRLTPPTRLRTKRSSTSVRHEHEEDVAAEPLPGPSHVSTPQSQMRNKRLYMSRGTAIERELEVRLERTRALKAQDEELHILRMKEQKLKVEEQEVRLAIAKKILKQEQLKTEKLSANDYL